VEAIRSRIRAFLHTKDDQDHRIGAFPSGIYAFYDYDGEPIYVGQTYEGLGSRIGRHLTNQRTDAVAMSVLDPFEVAEIRVWPIDLNPLADVPQEELTLAASPTTAKKKPKLNARQKAYLNGAEYTVFQKALVESKLGAVLNEKPPEAASVIELPKSYAMRIIPDEIYPHRKHPDVRIARRASTIASLARVISERKAPAGLRATLLTQARRLERLAQQRLDHINARRRKRPDDEDLDDSERD
jgi:hypothetical protein